MKDCWNKENWEEVGQLQEEQVDSSLQKWVYGNTRLTYPTSPNTQTPPTALSKIIAWAAWADETSVTVLFIFHASELRRRRKDGVWGNRTERLEEWKKQSNLVFSNRVSGCMCRNLTSGKHTHAHTKTLCL